MKNGARFCLGSGRRMANEPNTARWSRPSLVMRKVKSKYLISTHAFVARPRGSQRHGSRRTGAA